MKIVIRTPNWLGDLVMSTAFVQAVIDTYPHDQVDLIVTEGLQDLPFPQRGVIHVFDSNKQTAGEFGRDLRQFNYDSFFVLPPSVSSAWMAVRSRAKKRIGYPTQLRGFLLNGRVPFQRKHRTQHLVDEYLQLLNPSFKKETFSPVLWADAPWVERNWPSSLKVRDRYIVLSPGAIYGPAKMWPVSHFRALAESLMKSDVEVVVAGKPQDHKAGMEIAQKNSRIHNLCGNTSLKELVAVLAKATAVVSNDSGAMHLAAALKRPQVAMFGSTTPLWSGPVNPQAKVLYLNLSCSPCFRRICPLGHTNCLNQISAETVMKQMKELGVGL